MGRKSRAKKERKQGEPCGVCDRRFPAHLLSPFVTNVNEDGVGAEIACCPICGLDMTNRAHNLDPSTPFRGPQARSMHDEALQILRDRGDEVASMTEQCAKIGCVRKARFHPILYFRPNAGSSGIEAAMNLPLCDTHVREVELNPLSLDPQRIAFNNAVEACRRTGLAIPKEEFTTGGRRAIGTAEDPFVQIEEAKEAMNATDAFHAHLDECDQCESGPFNLCEEGSRLLREAAEKGQDFVDGEGEDA